MATQGKIQTELRRKKLVERDSEKRKLIKEELAPLYHRVLQGDDSEVLFSDIERLQGALDVLTRNSSLKRRRNRCRITGRPRGYYRKFGLCRNMIRHLAMMGLIPGVVKSSW